MGLIYDLARMAKMPDGVRLSESYIMNLIQGGINKAEYRECRKHPHIRNAEGKRTA